MTTFCAKVGITVGFTVAWSGCSPPPPGAPETPHTEPRPGSTASAVDSAKDTPPQQAAEALGESNWPTTCDAAAEDILFIMTPREKEQLRATPAEELVLLHFSLGLRIRNRQGFWRGNVRLIESCTGSDTIHPDDASFEVIRRAWRSLQQG